MKKHKHKVIESSYKYLFNLGYTNEYDQSTLYWKLEKDIPFKRNPIKDGCGLIFFSPKIPFFEKDIIKAFSLLKKISSDYNYEIPVTFQFKSKQIVLLIFPIIFDRYNLDETKKALKYHAELNRVFIKNGYVPYRLNNIQMNKYFPIFGNYSTLVIKLKKIFDPKGLIDVCKYMKKTTSDKKKL